MTDVCRAFGVLSSSPTKELAEQFERIGGALVESHGAPAVAMALLKGSVAVAMDLTNDQAEAYLALLNTFATGIAEGAFTVAGSA